MNAYFDAMRKYADFTGRASRSQFWLYTLFYGLGLVVLAIVDIVVLGATETRWLTGLFTLAHLIPGLAVTIRRLHDAGYSGWWFLLSFTIVGVVVVFIFMLMPSTPGANKYGPQPGTEPDEQPVPHHTPRAEPDLAHRPPVAPQPPTQPTGGLDLDRLERLAKLRSSGLIDEDEFKQMKADIVGRGAS